MTASEVLFNQESSVAPVGIIAMESATELGSKINSYLVDWAKKGGRDVETMLIEAECPRFSSGDGKGYIKSTVRGKDLYIIVDVGNYNCKYKLFSRENCMSPDDHFQDLKRIIQAASGKAHRITVIMPILYGGRQHRRNYRESLDCAWALQELERMGVSNIITFDAHDPRVQNAVPLMGIDNVMPTYQVLKSVIKNIPDIELTKDKFMIVSPDEGALNRNMYYASVLGVELGMFYKRR
ncbi:MAG TPA: phosphoribosylpyrophosphate synthetase, partial [Ruminococcus sp.]|nr:phosphoribosylpyrophosphate synthetase [Ruminococcus sp.]